MDVIGGDAVPQNRHPMSRDCFPQPIPVGVTVPFEAQQKLPVMAAVGQMIDMSGDYISVGSWHNTPNHNPINPHEQSHLA
jgi:hypothetical protein